MIELVKVSNFSLGKFQVTNSQYLEFCGKTGGNWPVWAETRSDYNLKTGTIKYYQGFTEPDQPVVGVSQVNAAAFCKWISKKTGENYRLPTEEEWLEAVGKCRFSGSDDVDEVAWYSGNSGGKTHPVGLKKPNELGIYDMSGNVLERCQDRVLRGGSWDINPELTRYAYRYWNYPDYRHNFIGFRVARDN